MVNIKEIKKQEAKAAMRRNILLFALCLAAFGFGFIWLGRCRQIKRINCGVSLVSPYQEFESQPLIRSSENVTSDVGAILGWLNSEEIAVFSPPPLEEKLDFNKAKLEIYSLAVNAWRTVDISPILCSGTNGRIEFNRFYNLPNGNPAIEVACFGWGEGTTIYEMILVGDDYQFISLWETDSIQPFYSDIEIDLDKNTAYLVDAYDFAKILKSSTEVDPFVSQDLFPSLRIGRNSEIALTNDGNMLAISALEKLSPARNKSTYSIYVADLAIDEATPLFGSVWQLRNLQWSADGEALLFTGAIRGNEGIWLIDLQTDSLRLIHPLEYSGFEVYWSPDNRHILFETDHDQNGSTPGRFEILRLN